MSRQSEVRQVVKRLAGRRLVAAVRAYRMPELTVSRKEVEIATDRREASEHDRLRMRAESAAEVRLHVGCGARVLAGWLNLDLSYSPPDEYLRYYGERFYPEAMRGDQADFFAVDVARGLPLAGDSVDVVFHEDFLEHLDQPDAVGFLAETFRVLKPGAIHRINTPDLVASMVRHSDFSKGVGGLHTEEWSNHGHLNIFTREYLRELASAVGYSEVHFNGRDQSAYSGLPPEYRPAGDRAEDGNLFADLVK